MILKLHPAAPALEINRVRPHYVPLVRPVYPAGRQLSVVARAFLDYLLGRGNAAPTIAAGKK